MTAPVSPTPTTPVAPPPPAPPRPTRLTRPRDDRVIAGVASGIARHLGLDPALVRLAFVVLTLAGGSGVLAYLIAWLVIPEEPRGGDADSMTAPPTDPTALRLALGGLLVVLGGAILVARLVPGISQLTWPLALIVIGCTIILAGARR